VGIQNRKVQNSLRSVGNCFASRSNFLLCCVRIIIFYYRLFHSVMHTACMSMAFLCVIPYTYFWNHISRVIERWPPTRAEASPESRATLNQLVRCIGIYQPFWRPSSWEAIKFQKLTEREDLSKHAFKMYWPAESKNMYMYGMYFQSCFLIKVIINLLNLCQNRKLG
jgi:hypothetical protein